MHTHVIYTPCLTSPETMWLFVLRRATGGYHASPHIAESLPQWPSTGAPRRMLIKPGKHLGHRIFAGVLGILQPHRTTHQLVAARHLQIIRNPRSIGQIGYR